jgi:hypothetical protein
MFIEVFDDIIPPHLVDYYELAVMGRGTDQEKSMHAVVDLKCRYESTGEENGKLPLSFVHVLKSSTALSTHLDNFGLIPQLACAEINSTLTDIILARIFVLVPYRTNLEHYAPHTDLPFDHYVVLYYVNDSDGDTVFFQNGKIVKRVSPKRGRLIIFDGRIEHGGGIPTTGPRCAVNFDIRIDRRGV